MLHDVPVIFITFSPDIHQTWRSSYRLISLLLSLLYRLLRDWGCVLNFDSFMREIINEISTRKDVAFLVRDFYKKVRKDAVLGPIFNNIIHDWEAHLEKLTDFWEGNLFHFVKTGFTGDPKSAHQLVDEKVNYSITMEHFGLWLNLWIATIDENFEGDTAQLAKNQARKMATFLFIKIFENRPDRLSANQKS